MPVLRPANLSVGRAAGVPPAHPGVFFSERLHETAPDPQCHASALADAALRRLVAAWIGTRERDPDVCIHVVLDPASL